MRIPIFFLFLLAPLSSFAADGWLCCEKAFDNRPFGPGGIRICGQASPDKNEAIRTYNENCNANDNSKFNCWRYRQCERWKVE